MKLNVWKVTLAMPEKGAPDVVKRKITYNPGHAKLLSEGQTEIEVIQEVELGAALPATCEVTVLEGIPSTPITFVDIDNAGNASTEPRVFDLNTEDHQAPPQPGEAGVQSVEELVVDVPDDVPVPPAE